MTFFHAPQKVVHNGRMWTIDRQAHWHRTGDLSGKARQCTDPGCPHGVTIEAGNYVLDSPPDFIKARS